VGAPIYGIQASPLQPRTRNPLQRCDTTAARQQRARLTPPPLPTLSPHPRQVSESMFVYGAPDEWLWHTELSRLNKTVQSPGLTNVYWCWGCEHADNMDGASPAAFLDHDKALTRTRTRTRTRTLNPNPNPNP